MADLNMKHRDTGDVINFTDYQRLPVYDKLFYRQTDEIQTHVLVGENPTTLMMVSGQGYNGLSFWHYSYAASMVSSAAFIGYQAANTIQAHPHNQMQHFTIDGGPVGEAHDVVPAPRTAAESARMEAERRVASMWFERQHNVQGEPLQQPELTLQEAAALARERQRQEYESWAQRLSTRRTRPRQRVPFQSVARWSAEDLAAYERLIQRPQPDPVAEAITNTTREAYDQTGQLYFYTPVPQNELTEFLDTVTPRLPDLPEPPANPDEQIL